MRRRRSAGGPPVTRLVPADHKTPHTGLEVEHTAHDLQVSRPARTTRRGRVRRTGERPRAPQSRHTRTRRRTRVKPGGWVTTAACSRQPDRPCKLHIHTVTNACPRNGRGPHLQPALTRSPRAGRPASGSRPVAHVTCSTQLPRPRPERVALDTSPIPRHSAAMQPLNTKQRVQANSDTCACSGCHTFLGAGSCCCCCCCVAPMASDLIWSCRCLLPNSRGDEPFVKWPI
jgi:hypothetical protein